MRRAALDELLTALETPAAPAGGSAAAWTAALSASLVVMVGKGSPAWPGGAAAAEHAIAARDRLAGLAEDDAAAVGDLLDAVRAGDATRRESALLAAACVPCAIAERAAAVAVLAAAAADEGKRTMAADAEVALALARAATVSAARIVEVNLALLADPASTDAAGALRARADAARERAARACA